MKERSIMKVYRKILEQLESAVKLRGNTGWGSGHPHPHQTGTKRVYGKSEIAHQAADDKVDAKREDEETEVITDDELVPVSRAFDGEGYE
jgi:hypothetical protein